MKNRKLFVKIVFIALIVLLLFSLVAPAIFAQPVLTSPKRETLLNGLKLLMWPDDKADKVRISIRVHAGSAFDPQTKEGVMQLLADNIFPNEAAKDFFTDDLGGNLEIISNYDYIQVNASAKPSDFLTMLETLSTAVSNPPIDKETTARLRAALMTKVKAMEADPTYIADQAVARRLFGTFPYGRPQMGSEASIKALDFADLVEAKQRFLTADNATVAVSGNFDRSLGLRAIRRYFGGWLKADKRVPSTFRQPDDPPPALLNVVSPKPAIGALRFAMRGVARGDKDLAASLIFTSILETRLKARVPVEHSGDVFVRNQFNTLPGIIVIGFSADKNMFGAGNGKVEANDLVGKALADHVTDAEFNTAKAALQSAWAKRDPILFWLDAETYKLGDPNADARTFDNVTAVDVRTYAERLRKMPIASVLVNSSAAAK